MAVGRLSPETTVVVVKAPPPGGRGDGGVPPPPCPQAMKVARAKGEIQP